MPHELLILTLTAASLGFIHTLFGPDHYLPFIVMARAGKWSLVKTTWITTLCGIGHILSSVILGLIGIAFGIAVFKLEAIESFRGNIAGWALIAFGLAYFAWGLRKAIRNCRHEHWHNHGDGHSHAHSHTHAHEHTHVHEGKATLTPWILFTIFVFGPCEPLIPLVMYPAAKKSLIGVVLVAGVFGTITIMTMLSIVLVSYFGIRIVPMKSMERYTHAMAGGCIFLCGMAIQFLGL